MLPGRACVSQCQVSVRPSPRRVAWPAHRRASEHPGRFGSSGQTSPSFSLLMRFATESREVVDDLMMRCARARIKLHPRVMDGKPESTSEETRRRDEVGSCWGARRLPRRQPRVAGQVAARYPQSRCTRNKIANHGRQGPGAEPEAGGGSDQALRADLLVCCQLMTCALALRWDAVWQRQSVLEDEMTEPRGRRGFNVQSISAGAPSADLRGHGRCFGNR